MDPRLMSSPEPIRWFDGPRVVEAHPTAAPVLKQRPLPFESSPIQGEVRSEVVSQRHAHVVIPSGPAVNPARDHPLPRDVEGVEIDLVLMTSLPQLQD